MLKIYIQIFGTIALVAIILINYNIFYRTPAEEAIADTEEKLQKVEGELKLMDSILQYQGRFQVVEQVLDRDREIVRLELPTSFSPPDRTKRIYDLILAANLESTGIPVGAPLPAKTDAAKLTDVVSLMNEGAKFLESIDSFNQAMAGLDGKLPQFTQPGTSPIERWSFYEAISKGKDDYNKMKLTAGLERHRYRLNLTGTYANIKRFLWLVANDKPLLQATSVRIVPKAGVGDSRLFTLDVIVIAYADRNNIYEQLNQDPVALLSAKAPEAAKPAEPAAK